MIDPDGLGEDALGGLPWVRNDGNGLDDAPSSSDIEASPETALLDALLLLREGPDALTSARAQRLAEFRRAQALERKAALHAAEQNANQIGSVIAEFRRRRGWTHWQVADWLRISEEDLGRLARETCPRDGAAFSLAPMNALARRYGVRMMRLFELFAYGAP